MDYVKLVISAQTGGYQSRLLVADLYRMYVRYTERIGANISNVKEDGYIDDGYKEVTMTISGDNMSELIMEHGVHRSLRIPTDDDRIHQSAVLVTINDALGADSNRVRTYNFTTGEAKDYSTKVEHDLTNMMDGNL